MTYIRAIGSPPRKDNSHAIVDCLSMGYLADETLVADLTYGEGRWWRLWKPKADFFFPSDLDPAKSPSGGVVDFRATPYPADMFATVCFDPPYKLNGTSTAGSPSDEAYGVADKATIMERHTLMLEGLTECHRIVEMGGYVLAKCQDQVSSGRMQWQTHMMALHAGAIGLEYHDSMLVMSYREQPKDRNQTHVHRDYSTLQVFRKAR